MTELIKQAAAFGVACAVFCIVTAIIVVTLIKLVVTAIDWYDQLEDWRRGRKRAKEKHMAAVYAAADKFSERMKSITHD